jgi:hypothetical protein
MPAKLIGRDRRKPTEIDPPNGCSASRYSAVRVGEAPKILCQPEVELIDVFKANRRPNVTEQHTSAAYASERRESRYPGHRGGYGCSDKDALVRAADNRDVVITSGGVSMGDRDLVGCAKEIGAEIYFYGL